MCASLSMSYTYWRKVATDFGSPEMVDRYALRIGAEMKRIIGSAGKVIDISTQGVGTGFAVVFNTEYAALKAYYAYRHSNPSFGQTSGGWYISLRK